jgi:ribosome-associated protein
MRAKSTAGTQLHGDDADGAAPRSAGATAALIVGADAFLGLPTWYRWRELFDLAHVVVVAGPGSRSKARCRGPRAGMNAAKHLIRGRCRARTVERSSCSRSLRTRFRRARSVHSSRAAAMAWPPCAVCFRPLFWPILTATNSIALARMRLNKIQKTAVTALEDIKARDISVLDVRKLTSLYDTLVIASAESNRQVKALANHVRDKLKQGGATILGVEGEESGEWVLVDAGDIVVHIMQPAVRAYYNLEELWGPGKPARTRAKAADRRAA